jgi:hypothetical protein
MKSKISKYIINIKSAKFFEAELWFKGNLTFLNNAKLRYESRKSDYLFCAITWNTTCTDQISEESRKNLDSANKRLNANFLTMDDLFDNRTKVLDEKKGLLDDARNKLSAAKLKIDNLTHFIWTIINALFVFGGMLGKSRYL